MHPLRLALARHWWGGGDAPAAAPLSGPPSRRLPGGATRVGYWAATSWDGVARTNPRKRVGTAEDIAGLTIFLCSRAGAYTIGETICCDGGVAIS